MLFYGINMVDISFFKKIYNNINKYKIYNL